MDICSFFPAGASISALPDWKNPRMLVGPGRPFLRWRWTQAYPASRWVGRVRRILLRGLCSFHLLPERKVGPEGDRARSFLEELGLEGQVCAIWVGMAGTSQKWTLFLADQEGHITGYLKVGESPLAQRRLASEYALLTRLPPEIGPRALGLGQIGGAKALLLEALQGHPMPAQLPCPDEVVNLANRLVYQESYPFSAHPWIRWLEGKLGRPLDGVEPLTSRLWPTVLLHGDFAPWNILRLNSGGLKVLDWEYGAEKGFPWIDLVYYQLQVAALVQRKSAEKAFRMVQAWLRQSLPELKVEEIRALIVLTGWYAIWQRRVDGFSEEDALLRWRMELVNLKREG